MKRLIALFLAGMLLLAFAACGETEDPNVTEPETTLAAETDAPAKDAITLVAAFGPEEDSWKTYEVPFAGMDNLGVEDIANALTELTGISFTLNSVTPGGGMSALLVDFSDDSALVTGPPEEQKEDFFMYDRDSLVLFMLDSLYFSIVGNLPIFGDDEHAVYFTLNGEAISLEGFGALPDEPYRGSGLFEGRGDMFDDEAAVG